MPQLEIEVHGPLMVGGGHAATLGVDATTARRFHDGLWVPYLPATAIRGAVRQQLEALLAGAGEDVTGPYPFEGDEPGGPADDPVAEIFGHSGPDGRRSGAREGCVRFGDGVPVDREAAEAAVARLSVRPGVALDDHRGSAEDRKLFFRELAEVGAESLRFVADLRVHDLSAEHERMLRAAVETTTALGAAKASGGGRVEMTWKDDVGAIAATEVSGDPSTAVRARITLTCREPLHLGDGGPLGNYHGTRTHVPGATLRGAVAWALLRADVTTPESEGFRALFLDEAAPVSFGDALAVRPGTEGVALPGVVPTTRRRTRDPEGRRVVDLLAGELAREHVNRLLERNGAGVYLQAEAGDRKLDPVPSRPAPGLLRRVRTRVSIDRHSGTAADGRLFSIEQVEAWALEAGGDAGPECWPVTFVATVEGLGAEAASLLARLDGVPLLVGGRRNHGLGAVQAKVELRPADEPEVEIAMERVDHLAAEVERAEAALTERVGAGLDELADGDNETSEPLIPLAMTATSDFVPEEDDDHPLRTLSPDAGPPVRRFLVPGFSGGYDQRESGKRGADAEPLKTLHPTAGAGSVYVYRVRRGELSELLGAVLPRLARGVGGRRESGCGRFEIFQPLSQTQPGPARPEPTEE